MIAVGIKVDGNTTNWYKAHSLNRRPDGSMCVFGLDDQRTTYTVPARLFAGVMSNTLDYNGQEHPDISEAKL